MPHQKSLPPLPPDSPSDHGSQSAPSVRTGTADTAWSGSVAPPSSSNVGPAPPGPEPEEPWSHHHAVADDGARLSYYSIPCDTTSSSGSDCPSPPRPPAILIMHGPVSYALTHQDVAAHLSAAGYTAHAASRRGRGHSDPWPAAFVGSDGVMTTTEQLRIGSRVYPRTYSSEFTAAVFDRELRDLESLIAATDPDLILALSTSADVVLLGLLAGPSRAPNLCRVAKLVLYEPLMFFIDREHRADMSLLGRYEREMAADRDADAMTTSLMFVQLASPWIPRPVMTTLVSIMMQGQERRLARARRRRQKREESGEAAGERYDDHGVHTVRAMAPLMRFDFAIIAEATIASARLAGLRRGDMATDGPSKGDVGQAGAGGENKAESEKKAGGEKEAGDGGRGEGGQKEGREGGGAGGGKGVRDPWEGRVAVLCGEKSPAFLRQAQDVVAAVVPGAIKVVVPGWGHEIVTNGETWGGQPYLLVPPVRDFAPPGEVMEWNKAAFGDTERQEAGGCGL